MFSFQFQPGQSGNPGGKPKIHQRIGAEYAARLMEPVAEEMSAARGALGPRRLPVQSSLSETPEGSYGETSSKRRLKKSVRRPGIPHDSLFDNLSFVVKILLLLGYLGAGRQR